MCDVRSTFIHNLKFLFNVYFMSKWTQNTILCSFIHVRKIAEFLWHFFLELSQPNYIVQSSAYSLFNELLFTNQTFQIDVYDATVFYISSNKHKPAVSASMEVILSVDSAEINKDKLSFHKFIVKWKIMSGVDSVRMKSVQFG